LSHSDLFDRYREGQSPVHRLDPRVKVVVAFLFILSTVLLPDGAWLAFGLSFILLLGISYASGLGTAFTVKRSFIALPFVLAAAAVVFSVPGNILFTLNIWHWHLQATDAGLIRFGSIVIRSWISIQVAILLVATTQFPDMMHALRHLKVPGILVSIISFMYRYLHVLVDETMRLLRAREARSARLPAGHYTTAKLGKPGGSIGWRARIAGNMAGQLFIRSYERSDRVYNAMVARGYTGTLQTLNPHRITVDDWLLGSLVVLLLIIIQVIARI
jgi:cobalt/nickel transport system permease protein